MNSRSLARMARVLAALALAAATSCDHGHDHDHPHPHDESDDGPPSTQATIWTSDHELFVEHPLPIVGEPARFAIHVSLLAAGEPKRVGALLLRAGSSDGRTLEARRDAPDRDGIWLPELSFDAAGSWRVTVVLDPGAPGEVAIDLPTVVVHPTAQAAADAAPADEGGGDGIQFLKEQQWIFKTRTAAAARGVVRRTLSLPAVVVIAPEGKAAVAAPISGRVLSPLSGALPRLGERVVQGQPMARLEPPLSGADFLSAILHHHELQLLESELTIKLASAQADESLTERELVLASSTLARVRELAEAKAKSTREVLDAEFGEESARGRLAAARAAKEIFSRAVESLHAHPAHDENLLERFPPFDVIAPVSGIVDRVAVSEGEFAAPGAPLFTIIDPERLHIVAALPERSAGLVAGPIEAWIQARDAGIAGAAVVAAEVIHVGLELDDSRSVPITVRAREPLPALRAGAAVTVLLGAGAAEEGLVVPESALIDELDSPAVIVQRGGETFERRFVTVGARDRGAVAILSGIEDGDRIVIDGARIVQLAGLGSSAPAHHHH